MVMLLCVIATGWPGWGYFKGECQRLTEANSNLQLLLWKVWVFTFASLSPKGISKMTVFVRDDGQFCNIPMRT